MLTILNLNTEPQHLNTLANWHHQQWSYLNPGESINDRINKMQPCLNSNLIPSTFIAKDKALLGSAALVANDMETYPQLSPWLASVYVAPAHRNKGIGTKLVHHVMQQAKHHALSELFLFTPDKTDFYKRLGWKVIKEESYHGEKVSIMAIKLT